MSNAAMIEQIFGKKCGDCGGRYWTWINHLFSRRHQKWLLNNHPNAYRALREHVAHARAERD